jgi:hypothetical protein
MFTFDAGGGEGTSPFSWCPHEMMTLLDWIGEEDGVHLLGGDLKRQRGQDFPCDCTGFKSGNIVVSIARVAPRGILVSTRTKPLILHCDDSRKREKDLDIGFPFVPTESTWQDFSFGILLEWRDS